jgi:hypothetical protein
VDAEDIQHAVRNAAVIESIAEGPSRYLVPGPAGRRSSWNSS